MKLSVLIPSKNEPYLERTVQDVLTKSKSRVEILVYKDTGKENGLRRGINELAKSAKGEFLMKLDAHCMVDEDFDLKLLAAHQPNWVQVPRRKRLNAERWEVINDGREPVDYEAVIFSNLLENGGRLQSKGFIWAAPWDELTRERTHISLDDTPHFQGSCWFMAKEWFTKCGFMGTAYGGFAQEPEEIIFTTLKNGGEVKVNKTTWYAHLYKDKEARELFEFDGEDLLKGYAHSYNLWVRDNRKIFETLIDSFPLMPTFPPNWKQILWN